MSQIVPTGRSINQGDTIEFPDEYNIKLDRFPEELVKELREEYGSEYNLENELTAIGAAVEYVEQNIQHENAVAREKGKDKQSVREDRLRAQGERYAIRMSSIWDGAYDNRRVGTCKERALTLHALLKEMGIESEYRVGYYLEEENGGIQRRGHAWVETGDFVADPSSVGGMFYKNGEKFDTEYKSTSFQVNTFP